MHNTKKQNAIIHLYSTLWRYAEGSRSIVVLYVALSVISMVITLLAPLILGELLNALQRLSGADLERRAWELLLAFLAVGLLDWFFHGPSRYLEQMTASVVKRTFQQSLLTKVTALPTRWHRDHHSGKTIDQVAQAIQSLHDFTSGGFEVLHLLVRYVMSVVVLTWFLPSAGLVIGAVTGIVILAIINFDRRLVRQYREINESHNGIAATVQDYLTNISTIISLRLEDRVVREVYERVGRIFPLYRRNIVTNELKWCTTSYLVDGARVVVLLMLIIPIARGHTTIAIGTVYAVSEYLRAIGEAFFVFTYKYGQLVVQSTKVAAIEHIERAYDADVRIAHEAKLPPGWRSLEIRDLRFSHGTDLSEEGAALDVRSLTLVRGRSFAFVGESGSGKSTMLGVLRGIHTAQQGTLYCDGIRLEHGLAHVNHQTTLIPQDPELFSDTIRFNVTLGIETSEERVARAIARARFEPVLHRLPHGLDTNIAEKGVSLSGGEKQRLALARGFFFEEEIDSGIVLLDEPTSSVDVRNERLIYERLLRERGSRCIISSIHKFNLLSLFDEVVVFSAGRIVEQGPAQELRSRRGELARLAQAV